MDTTRGWIFERLQGTPSMNLVVMYFDLYHSMRSSILGVLNVQFKVFHCI